MSTPSTPAPPSAVLREPAHRVCPRAVGYWRVNALIGGVVIWAVAVTAYVLVPARPWWATALLVLALVLPLVQVVAMPPIRFRIHRWEIDDLAIYTRSGWIVTETRVAPLSRVQTVDSQQGAIMRLFRLSSLTVTTASAAGPISIEGLDQDHAKELVARLTAITGASEGDAT